MKEVTTTFDKMLSIAKTSVKDPKALTPLEEAGAIATTALADVQKAMLHLEE